LEKRDRNRRKAKKEVNIMDNKRKGEITLALVELQLRQKTSLGNISRLKKEVDDLIKEPELEAINVTYIELIEIIKSLVEKIFEKQIRMV